MSNEAIAIEEVKKAAGGSARLSEALGDITSQAVSLWKRVPAGRVLAVESITGISRHKLRPDVFGSEPSKKLKRSAGGTR